MRLTPQDIKNHLAVELQKQGATLADLEEAMQGADSFQKIAENMEKRGWSLVEPFKALVGTGKALGYGALGTGALGGAGLYAAYKANQDSNDKQLKMMQEAADYQNAMKSLHDAYAQDQLQPT